MLILTRNAVLKCDHAGRANCRQSAQSWVSISECPVLIGADPTGRVFGSAGPSCSLAQLPCAGTLAPSAGHSSFVSIGGVAICLDTITGPNQPNPGPYSVSDPGQHWVRVSA